MPAASYVQEAFLGGEWSQSAQGHFSHPDYRKAMNVCLNTIPVEAGAAQRRPGTRTLQATRKGLAGRVLPYTFQQNFPYLLEFTDGYLRYFTGTELVMTNDPQAVVSISTANPAVVTTNRAHGWFTGNAVMFNSLGALGNANPRLQNRVFEITVLSATTFSLVDQITGATIDGSTLGTFVSGNVARVNERQTSYTNSSWANIRTVQAETKAILLNGTAPQVVEVEFFPTASQFASFRFGAVAFIDGPYFPPFPGSQVSSSGLTGEVTLTLGFQTYSATIAYSTGDYVTYAGQGYRSLLASNLNHQPDISATAWTPVNAGDPINEGRGLVDADVARHMRLLSEPPLWDVTATYVAKQVVAYADGLGGYSYWTATGAVAAGIQPGTSTLWAINATGAIWTWGRILSVSTAGVIAPATAVGTMTGGGGLASAFDGNPSKSFASSASISSTVDAHPVWSPFPWPIGSVVFYQGYYYRLDFLAIGGVAFIDFTHGPAGYPFWTNIGTPSDLTIDGYVGQHYGVAKTIASVTISPTVDLGFTNAALITLNVRAKNTAPASAADGTLLGTAGTIGNTFSPVTINSTDTTTTYLYVWVEAIVTYAQPLPGLTSFTGEIGIAQVAIRSPDLANGSAVTLQIVGPALLYAGTIRTWRLGLFGGENGWPTCGTYHEGRLWLSGTLGNRLDGSKSNDIFNFAPTGPSGLVADDNAISAVFDGPDVNKLLWMVPDQQGILCGTQAGEWLVSPAAPGAISPTNIAARRVTTIGCADIEPRRSEHALLFVQRYGRKIMEYFADVYSGKLSAPNLSEKAKHLTTNGIAEIAYQQELNPMLWARKADGMLIGTTYKRDSLTTAHGPNFAGWHRHTLGSARIVESICAGPSSGGNLDSLSMVTRDPATGLRYVEVMADLLDEGFALSSAWMLDGGIAATSSTRLTEADLSPYGGLQLNGLWLLNDKTVDVVIGGLDCGSFTVSNGSVTVPYGDGVSAGTADGAFTLDFLNTINTNFAAIPMAAGFTYTSQGQIVRAVLPQETGLPTPAIGTVRRSHMFAAHLYGALTGKVSFGTKFTDMHAAKFQTPGGTKYTASQMFSGIHQDTVEADSDFDNMLCWQVTRPAPLFVISLAMFLKTQGR